MKKESRVVLFLIFSCWAGVRAIAQTITEFPLPNPSSGLRDIATGPDGNLWFVEADGNRVGKISTSGSMTEYPLPVANRRPRGVIGGPDGNVWFTEQNGQAIGRVTPSGTITEFATPSASAPIDITVGPDGNLWISDTRPGATNVWRGTTSGVITAFPAPSPVRSNGITVGSDGNLWFTEFFDNQIGRVTSSGVFTEFPIPTASSGPWDIALGPDGSLWFTEFTASAIGRISIAGTVTEFPLPTTDAEPQAIIAGPDDRLWFIEQNANKIGAITTAGVITEYPLPTADSAPSGICVGPDGNIWFTEILGNQIGRLTVPSVSSFAPAPLALDKASSATSNGNGVFEPGEEAVVESAWKNTTASPFTGTGALVAFTGPAGSTYSIVDGSADYGTIPAGGIGSCAATADCYRVSVPAPAIRPSTHWDAALMETLSRTPAETKTWSLHLGDSFSDVPRTSLFYGKVEALLHSGLTTGCGPGSYCPAETVTRAQMAIFLARGIAGEPAAIPEAGTIGGADYQCKQGGVSLFTDVSPTEIFCRHVHFLAGQNVTLGCAADAYCPNATLTRREMAALVAKAIQAPGGGAAIPKSYGPDPSTGFSYDCNSQSPTIHFDDVPAADPFCKHAHFLWARGIIGGCSSTAYCPDGPITRDAMAKFLVNAFSLASDEWTVRAFNADDELSIVLNGETLATAPFCGDTGDIPLPLRSGTNILEFVLVNGPPGEPGDPAAVAWGYRLEKNGITVLEDSCGQACVVGCNDNAEYPQGEVFRNAFTLYN